MAIEEDIIFIEEATFEETKKAILAAPASVEEMYVSVSNDVLLNQLFTTKDFPSRYLEVTVTTKATGLPAAEVKKIKQAMEKSANKIGIDHFEFSITHDKDTVSIFSLDGGWSSEHVP